MAAFFFNLSGASLQQDMLRRMSRAVGFVHGALRFVRFGKTYMTLQALRSMLRPRTRAIAGMT
jgi:hypothetical protein